jgi:hypothetical protein
VSNGASDQAPNPVLVAPEGISIAATMRNLHTSCCLRWTRHVAVGLLAVGCAVFFTATAFGREMENVGGATFGSCYKLMVDRELLDGVRLERGRPQPIDIAGNPPWFANPIGFRQRVLVLMHTHGETEMLAENGLRSDDQQLTWPDPFICNMRGLYHTLVNHRCRMVCG